MDRPLFDEGAVAFASLALEEARGALVNVDVGPDAKGAAVLALTVAPWPRGIFRKEGVHHLAAVILAAVASPYLLFVSCQPRQLIFELRHADLIRLKGEESRQWRVVLIKARIFPKLTPSDF